MLWGGVDTCDLELRAGRGKSRRLRGRFPYGKRAILSDGGKKGRPRKEVIEPRAFAYRVEKSDEDIHLLVGHSYDRPLASRGAGTLDLRDTDDALTFEAVIVPEIVDSPYGSDFLAGFIAGLITGISPGFRIPPERTVPDAETVEEEDPQDGLALIRHIWAALLYELSLVTVPAYKEASAEEIEARSWTVTRGGLTVPANPLNRWRL